MKRIAALQHYVSDAGHCKPVIFYPEIHENAICSLQQVTNMRKQGREINAN